MAEAGGPANIPEARGGYQAPGNPAAASGPGSMSARTDGQPGQAMQRLANAKYGEQQAFQQQQSGAPMAAAPGVGHGPSNGAFAQALQGNQPNVTPLHASSERPGEPVTAGASRGAGPGPEALNLPPSTNKQDYMALRPALPALQMLANLPGATPGAKQFVRYLQSGGLPPLITAPPGGAGMPGTPPPGATGSLGGANAPAGTGVGQPSG
jgi:hypothetical protein